MSNIELIKSNFTTRHLSCNKYFIFNMYEKQYEFI